MGHWIKWVTYAVVMSGVRVVGRSRRLRRFLGSLYQNYQHSRRNLLQQAEISALFPGIYEVPVSFWRAEWKNGNMPFYELYLLCALVSKTQSRNIFEIGTFDGRTSLHFALNSPADAKVFTLDLPAAQMHDTKFALPEDDVEFVNKPQIGERYRGSDVEHKITQLYGDSAVFDFRPFYGKMDFVLVDGCRAYEYVKSDSQNAFQLLAEKGIIVWHNYGSAEGVTRALDELSRQKTIYQLQDTTIAVFVK